MFETTFALLDLFFFGLPYAGPRMETVKLRDHVLRKGRWLACEAAPLKTTCVVLRHDLVRGRGQLCLLPTRHVSEQGSPDARSPLAGLRFFKSPSPMRVARLCSNVGFLPRSATLARLDPKLAIIHPSLMTHT